MTKSVAVFLLILSVVLTLVTFRWIVQFPGGLVPDDGFFYGRIAFEIGLHKFSSFDGINPTDGYHQLWEYILAAFAWVIGFFNQSRMLMLEVFLWLDYLLLTFAAYLAGRTVLQRVTLFLLLMCCEFLMEGHLIALLLAVLAYCLFSERSKSADRWMWASAALLPLARIDVSIVVFLLALVMVVGGNRKVGLALFGALVVGVFAHFGLMEFFHRHLFSVSSEVKASRASGLMFAKNLFSRSAALPIPVDPQGLIAVVLGVLSGVVAFRYTAPEKRNVAIGLWLGATAFTGIHLALSWIRPWYYVPAFTVYPTLLFLAVEDPKVARWIKGVTVAGTAVGGLMVAYVFVRDHKLRYDADATNDFISEVDKVVPEDEAIFMYDGSGYVGYRSWRSIIDGDGLVNSHEYARLANAHQLGSYLTDHNIHYIITDVPREDEIVGFAGLNVTRSQVEPILSKHEVGLYPFTYYVLWKLKTPKSP